MRRNDLEHYHETLSSLNKLKESDLSPCFLNCVVSAGRSVVSLDQMSVDIAYRVGAKVLDIRLRLMKLSGGRPFVVREVWPLPSHLAPPETPPPPHNVIRRDFRRKQK